MLETSPTRAVCLGTFSHQLQSERYSRKVVSNYPSRVDRFLDYLESKGLTVHSVQPTEVDRYLKTLRMVRKRRGRLARKGLRRGHRAAIHMLLRLFHEPWPPTPAPVGEAEFLHRQIVAGNDAWLNEVHGIAGNTRYYRCAEAHRLLAWWAERGSGNPLSRLSVSDLDAFLQWRSTRLSRGSVAVVIGSLRSVLRYLQESGQVPVDLSAAIHAPRLYALDGIPSALRAEDVTKMLRSARAKRSPLGRRDYAILTLLLGPSTAGLASTALTDGQLGLRELRSSLVRWRVRGRWYAVTLEMQKNMASTLTTTRRVFARAAGSVSVQSKRTQWSSVNEAH